MKQNSVKFDHCKKESSTGHTVEYVKRTIERARLFSEDPDKTKRKALALCPYCFYLSSRIGGAAMTDRDCGLCGKEMTFGSTNTDILCVECGIEKNACKHCGADLDLKHRRKF